MRTAAFPGTFDPITWGHLDVLRRSLRLFERVIVLVAENPEKKPFFAKEERLRMVEQALQEVLTPEERAQVSVTSHSGLLVDFCRQKGVHIVVRGLRAVSDYEYELQMAHLNRQMYPDLETVFLVASPEHSFLSSSMVKQIARLGGDLKDLVPPSVERILRAHFPI